METSIALTEVPSVVPLEHAHVRLVPPVILEAIARPPMTVRPVRMPHTLLESTETTIALTEETSVAPPVHAHARRVTQVSLERTARPPIPV